MEEKKEGEKERGGSTKLKEEKGREVELSCVSQVSFIKVTTSVTHASIYRLGSFPEKLS